MYNLYLSHLGPAMTPKEDHFVQRRFVTIKNKQKTKNRGRNNKLYQRKSRHTDVVICTSSLSSLKKKKKKLLTLYSPELSTYTHIFHRNTASPRSFVRSVEKKNTSSTWACYILKLGSCSSLFHDHCYSRPLTM